MSETGGLSTGERIDRVERRVDIIEDHIVNLRIAAAKYAAVVGFVSFLAHIAVLMIWGK